MLQPVQVLLPASGAQRPCRASRATEHHPEHRVVAQPVVVDQVLVAERDAEHPLPDQRRHLVDHPFRRPPVGEAGREALDEPDRPVGRPEQQPAGVRGDRAAIEIRHHSAAIDPCNPIGFALHSVGIGEISCVDRSLCRRSTFPRSGPRCTYPW